MAPGERTMKKEMTLRWRLDEAQGVINELVKEKGKEKERIKALEQENAQLKQELEAKVTDGGTEGETRSGRKRRRRTREASENATILELPTEIWTKIAAKLTDDDALAFALTSRQLRVAQQQAERELVTIFFWNTISFSRDWCAWWSKRFNLSETAPNCMKVVIRVAAHEGYLDVLETYWSDLPEVKKKLLMDKRTCALAAEGGHLETLQWLRSQGCAWDQYTCAWAATHGHLKCLQWARSEGCPWDESTCSSAAERGHLEVLRWARDNGCPWYEGEICDNAADFGHLSVLKYARSQGCPWGTSTTYWAATRGHLEMLQWLRYEGCPWDKEQCREVGEPNIKRWMDELDAL